MTTVEINYQMAKLRDERQELMMRLNHIDGTMTELAKLRTRQQLASKRADDERYEIPESLYEEMFGSEYESGIDYD